MTTDLKGKKNTLENEKKNYNISQKLSEKNKQSSLGILKHKQFIHINLSSLLCHFFLNCLVCVSVSRNENPAAPPKPSILF